jgi:hypothetical protein
LLAQALDQGLPGQRPLETALEDYERLRNEQTLPDFRENIGLAWFTPRPPESRQLIAALRNNPEDTTRFFLAREVSSPARRSSILRVCAASSWLPAPLPLPPPLPSRLHRRRPVNGPDAGGLHY